MLAVAGPQAHQTGYVTRVVVVPAGGSLALLSAEHILTDHDVVHDVDHDTRAHQGDASWCGNYEEGECPLFWSKRINVRPAPGGDPTQDGPMTPVLGVEDLGPGEYPFFCSIHAQTMTGTLIVLPEV